MIKKIILIGAISLSSLMANTIVSFETTKGIFKVEVYTDNHKLDKTTKNFLTLVKNGYYNGTIFHRVIKGFMVQGGDPTGTGTGGESIYGHPFEDEIDNSLRFDMGGILAMANSGKNTNGSQFFITVKATPWLNGKHTIFGHLIEDASVIKKIEQAPVNSSSRPEEDIKIISVEILN